MNIASLPLCKELYELSGWRTPKFYWSEKTPKLCRGAFMEGVSVPAYSLGYLLRKLPNSIEGERPDDSAYTSLTLNTDGPRWRAYYEEGFVEEDDQMLHFNFAETPEDAACKLAIELFKQGILKKENPSE